MNYCYQCNEDRPYYPIRQNVQTTKLIKYLLMMKLIVLCTIISLQITAATFAQQITLNYKNAPLREVLQSIRKQTGYYFFFSSEYLEKASPVSVSVTDATLENTLAVVFKGQPFEYVIKGKMITIKPVEKLAADKAGGIVSVITVRGKVTDEEGNPLPGVSVILKEKNSKMDITDQQGNFSFEDIPDKGTLLFRMIGRETKEVTYENTTSLTIVLKETDADLKEIQIVAYGKVAKEYATSNINGISAAEIATQPVNDPILALSGRVPGLIVQQTGGAPGSALNVVIQGYNSISNGNGPFYVVDGMPYPVNNLGTISGTAYGYGGGNNFSYINPADIESIEILKDADATAIYGSRAANGAILITTKKGKSGKTVIDIRSQTGWGKITRKLDLLNTTQYIALRKEAYKNGGNAPGPGDYDINGVWDQNRYTNWQNVLVGGTAQFSDIQASISGGNTNTQFRTAIGFNRQTTVYPGDLNDKKVNLTFNINHLSTNQQLKFNLSGTYLHDNNRLYAMDLMTAAVTLAPNAPKLYNDDGTLNWEKVPNNPTAYSFDNPLAAMNMKYNAKTYNLLGNAMIGYEIIPGLEIKSTFGYNRITNDETNVSPQSSFRPDKTFLKRSVTYGSGAISSYIIEPQLTYVGKLFQGHFDALLGGTFQDNNNARTTYNATGFSTDEQLKNVQSATSITLTGNTTFRYRYSAIFGRLNYRYNDRYVINLTARRDGSSRFGPESLFNSFYSVGGAWLFNKEHFINKILPWLSTGKLRISYGTTGNDQIGEYGFLNLYDVYYTDIPYQNTSGLIVNGFSNPYLQWEETRKLNFGLDLGILDDAITLTSNFFRNRSSNQLLNDNVPAYTGFPIFRRNLPATVQNSGWEFLLAASPFKAKKVQWSTSLNLTIPRNKLVDYPNLQGSNNFNQFIIGQPTNIIRTFHLIGVNPETGLFEYLGSDGKPTSSPADPTDKTALVNVNPKFYGGFYNSVTYKGLNINFLFQFVKQTGVNYKFGRAPGVQMLNQPSSLLDRWQHTGDHALFQKISTNFGEILDPLLAIGSSDAAYSDASYIRLKNVSLSYNLPEHWMKKARLSQARIFVQGQNLLTFTNYFGSDPESQLSATLPPLKLFTTGVQLTL
ncbi:TonB-linked outer membrane protein, SusC/RagA family [Chitinophaga sp. YR627]|nr:TonB-linked outer membrane protein, SusC/RagA family [Chitinophaga sp. YR627]